MFEDECYKPNDFRRNPQDLEIMAFHGMIFKKEASFRNSIIQLLCFRVSLYFLTFSDKLLKVCNFLSLSG